MEYRTVICGGTFDRLHDGHKYFLRKIFSLGQRVLIGLTSDTYITEHKKGDILPFHTRLEELKTFLADEKLLIRAEIFPIHDIYGKAIDSQLAIDAIVVSNATVNGGEEINKKRVELGLPKLPIITLPLMEVNNALISSTKIREGHIGRAGEVYLDAKWTEHLLSLPKGLREVLHKPFHTILTGDIPEELLSDPSHIVTVGDATTKRFNEKHVRQALSVVDFSVERKFLFHSIEELGFSGEEKVCDVVNPSGHITPDVWEVVNEAISTTKNSRSIIRVDGEEDLLVIPLILLLPLGWRLFYGQPKEGVVSLEITEKIKEKVYDFLTQFVRE